MKAKKIRNKKLYFLKQLCIFYYFLFFLFIMEYANTHDLLDIKVYNNNQLINSFYKSNDELFCNIKNCSKKEDLVNEFYDLMDTISK